MHAPLSEVQQEQKYKDRPGIRRSDLWRFGCEISLSPHRALWLKPPCVSSPVGGWSRGPALLMLARY
jgi:hypothetical protein